MTLTIIALNVFSYLFFNLGSVDSFRATTLALGHIPAVVFETRALSPEMTILPEHLYPLTAITSAFLHADLMHLGGNMLFLWVFGDNVEDALGHFKFIIFYLACCFAAAWFHAFSFPASEGPLIGASGAAAGVVSAYLMLHPRTKIWVLFLGRIPVKLPAYLLLTLWVGFQTLMFLSDSENEVSWAAHIGGIIAGIVLVVVLKRPTVPLFDRELVLPEAVELEKQAELPPEIQPAEKPKPKRSLWGRGDPQN